MSDLTIADELEFESWPKEKQELAKRYLIDHFFPKDYNQGYDDGYEVGYQAAMRRANDSHS